MKDLELELLKKHAGLRPVLKQVEATAGNSSQMSDGAALSLYE
jgi:acetyl-CoA acetyltransferase